MDCVGESVDKATGEGIGHKESHRMATRIGPVYACARERGAADGEDAEGAAGVLEGP